MITLTTEQAQQIEEVLFGCRPTVISHENWNDVYKARAIITAARAQGECATLDAHWVSEEELPSFNAWLNLFVESRIMEDRAARAQKQPHPDDEAVDRFAAVMKAKLAKKRAEGRGGWEDKNYCSAEFLNQLLNEHVGKGDPVDVGNLAMMLWNRGERTEAIAHEQAEQEPVAVVEDWPTDSTPKGIVALGDIKELPAGTLLYTSPATSTEVFTREKVDTLLIAAYTKGRNDLLENQAEQEPVAWMVTSEGLDGTPKTYPLTGRFKDVCDMCDFGDPIPLYAAPVQQAEQGHIGEVDIHMDFLRINWKDGRHPPKGTKLYTAPMHTKDLTDDEIWEIHFNPEGYQDFTAIARAVIAKFKEKNK